jgi:adenosylcobinamide amidohydrolase
MDPLTHWETLLDRPHAMVRRRGRFVVADLRGPHRVISTSARNGGQTEHVRHLVNHQSCEGAGHDTRFRAITENGQEAYHDVVCGEVDRPADASATMGTAANMSYVSVVTEADGAVEVTAAVTAGVETNAVCAGDPAHWRESPGGIEKVPQVAGTINTILLLSTPVTPAALARCVTTMTEAKTAALMRLAAPSRYSSDLATGTGTDQYCLAAPLEGPPPLTSASPHMKLGEILGLAVRKATMEAVRWQNGLEPSYTRGVFHALGRYGVREATFMDDMAGRLSAEDLELLRRNTKAALYEPLVGASAHALATVLDRVRHGTLPDSVARDAMVQQAAMLAANLAARPERWPELRARLHASPDEGPKALVLAAIALGWQEKWRPA